MRYIEVQLLLIAFEVFNFSGSQTSLDTDYLRKSKSGLVIHVPMRMPSYDDVKKGFIFPSMQPMPMVVQWVNNLPVTLPVTEKPLSSTPSNIQDEPAIFDMSIMQNPVFSNELNQNEILSEQGNNNNNNESENDELGVSEFIIVPSDKDLASTQDMFNTQGTALKDEATTITQELTEFETTSESDQQSLISNDIEGSGTILNDLDEILHRSKRSDEYNDHSKETGIRRAEKKMNSTEEEEPEARRHRYYRIRKPHHPPPYDYYSYRMARRVGDACYGIYCQVKSFVKWLLI